MIAIFPGSTKGGGQTIGFPDVCKTPAPPAPFAPIPYPNVGMVNQGKSTAKKVKFNSKEVFTMKSKMSRSSGDEAGTMKGMVSQKNMDAVKPKMGVGKVKVMGAKCVRHLTMMGHNGGNANMPAGPQAAPSQTAVKVAP